MGIVVNDTVKMEWQEDRFLMATGRNKEKIFIMACKDYQTSAGVVPVMFNTDVAWLHIDDEGLFTFNDIKGFLKGKPDSNFPDTYYEYKPIMEVDGTVLNEALWEQYDLVQYRDEILKRIQDVAPYGEEKEMKLG